MNTNITNREGFWLTSRSDDGREEIYSNGKGMQVVKMFFTSNHLTDEQLKVFYDLIKKYHKAYDTKKTK